MSLSSVQSASIKKQLADQITCPISQDIMEHPVRISCPEEHSFDRIWIETAFTKSDLCPVCKGKVKDKILKINRELVSIVELYKQLNGSTLEERVQPVPPPTTPSSKLDGIARMNGILPPTPPAASIDFAPSAPPLTAEEAALMGVGRFDPEIAPSAPPKDSEFLASLDNPFLIRERPTLSSPRISSPLQFVYEEDAPSYHPLDEKKEKQHKSYVEIPTFQESLEDIVNISQEAAKSRETAKEEKEQKTPTPSFVLPKLDHPSKEEKSSPLFSPPKAGSLKPFDPAVLIETYVAKLDFRSQDEREYLQNRFLEKKWGEIQFAVVFGRIDVLEKLYRANPSVLQDCDDQGRTLLMIAARWGGHVEVGEWLLGKNPDLLNRVIKKRSFFSSLFSESPKESELQPGSTPLHFAAIAGDLEFSQWLMQKKPSLQFSLNEDGKIPLHLAPYNILKWFVEHDELLHDELLIIGRKSYKGISTEIYLHYWSWIRQSLETRFSAIHRDIFKAFLKSMIIDEDEKRALLSATITQLLYQEDPVFKKMADTRGYKVIPIFEYSYEHWGILQLSVLLGRLDVVQNFFKQDRTPNPFQRRKGSYGSPEDRIDEARDKERHMSLMHIACMGGHLEVVQWLAKQDRSLLKATWMFILQRTSYTSPPSLDALT